MSTATTEATHAAAKGEVIVSLSGVSKRYGPIQALQDVALELRAGEVHCLAGENGAGKSTLIKILTGAIRRDSGDYVVEGASSARRARWRRATRASASSTTSSACCRTCRWRRTC